MTRPKAIIVNLSTSGSRLGGAAIAAEWHARYLAKNFPVELWRMWDKDETITVDGLKIRNYNTLSKVGNLGNLLPRKLESCFLTSKILDDLIKEKPNIIHLQNPIPALDFKAIAMECARIGAKVVVSTHGFFEVMYPSYEFNFLEKIGWHYLIKKPVIDALNFVDAIVSGYPQEKDMLISHGVSEEKIKLIPNGVNPFFLNSPSLDECEAVLREFNIFRRKPILLFVGNHTANKGLPTVMQVAAKISSPVTIVIGGKCRTPNEADYWQKQIPPASHVNVVFTDYLTLSQQRALYFLSTLLLFPSLADTLPLTILEAMASKLAVVAYDVGGISYQLDEQSGLVVQPGNTAEFLSAVEFLLGNSEKRGDLILKAKKRQELLFSWEIVAEKTLDVYANLLT